jgi:bacillithiol system protein YtxJ
MGFFSKSTTVTFPWLELNSIAQLEELWDNSANSEKAILIFKHSTRCSISSMVKNQFEKNWNTDIDNCEVYYLDLIQFREVSNRIESLTGVVHQSPQAIVFKDKYVIYHESHNGIDAKEIENAL